MQVSENIKKMIQDLSIKDIVNSITKKKDAVTRCPDPKFNCKEILLEKLKHFVSKEALNIDGFGKKIIQNFWDLNMIKYPADIFNLNFKKISSLDLSLIHI